MANVNNYRNSNELEWIFTKKWGNTYVAPIDKKEWIFSFSNKPKKNWIYIDNLNVWRSNVSAV